MLMLNNTDALALFELGKNITMEVKMFLKI